MDITTLPKVSIITPTNNRKKQMKLALTNYRLFDYPREKLEWIVVDDGDYDIASVFPEDDQSIKYYHLSPYCKAQFHKMLKSTLKASAKNIKNKKKRNKCKLRSIHKEYFYKKRLPLGMKRNICLQYATGDVIFNMDDDNYYYPKAVYHAVSNLMKEWKNGVRCVGATTVAMFHTNRYLSLLYSRTDLQQKHKQVMEHTLCYDRKFWEERKYDNQDIIDEGSAFLKNRMHNFAAISGKEYGVSLVHNTNERVIKNFDNDLKDAEANGWHFKEVPTSLFLLMTSFDDEDVKDVEKLE